LQTQKAYYKAVLYPFQDGIISMMKELGMDFYLTGGTALSRAYYHHRFSDDLDFFTHNDPNFLNHVKLFLNALNDSGEYEIDTKMAPQITRDFSRLFIKSVQKNNEVVLKIDFVNDISIHYGEIIEDKVLGKLDSVENILINKITALTRFEPKDIADIWMISKNQSFSWEDIVTKAKNKDAGVNEEQAAGIIRSFPSKFMSKIIWNIEVNTKTFFKEIGQISQELAQGIENSLC
jgi:predicted nucleotidyltransferase component of viral defense system